jgi:adenylate cyclase
LLTSKEIIERTGISRATLNNYIGSGLVPRPQVLPPGPEHGAAPRIGYFPDDTIARIETIQRLKREGWSITRIAEHFAGRPGRALGEASAPAAAGEHPGTPPPPAAVRLPAAAVRTGEAAPAAPEAPTRAAPRATPAAGDPHPLTPARTDQPAYLVNDTFQLVWANDPARTSPLSPIAQQPIDAGSVFRHLLQLEEAAGRDALLRFHLQAARSRGATAAQLFEGLPQAESAPLEALYRDTPRPAGLGLAAQALLPRSGAIPPRSIHAVHFQEGVLFAVGSQRGDVPAGAPAEAPAAPTLTPVAVLAAVLHDAPGLWVRLAAEEYFELLNEIGQELDVIFREHRGSAPAPAGDALACYFLPQADASYLWDALAAAHQVREAMRQVSQRWQVRKGWDLELRVNIGIDEGQDWLGTIGPSGRAELCVLGDAAERAGQLSRCARAGAVLVTRNLIGKLPREQRQRITYGAPRLEGTPGEAPLLFTFARLADVAAPNAAPPAVADLAVAELLDLTPSSSHSPGGAR